MEKLTKREIELIRCSVKNEFERLSKDLSKCIHNYDLDEVTIDIACLDEFDRLLRKICRSNFGVHNE